MPIAQWQEPDSHRITLSARENFPLLDFRWFDTAHHRFWILRFGSAQLVRLFGHLITRSALAKTFDGMVNPICFAVLRLITNSNFVGLLDWQLGGLGAFEESQCEKLPAELHLVDLPNSNATIFSLVLDTSSYRKLLC